jgi:hypothetical protein
MTKEYRTIQINDIPSFLADLSCDDEFYLMTFGGVFAQCILTFETIEEVKEELSKLNEKNIENGLKFIRIYKLTKDTEIKIKPVEKTIYDYEFVEESGTDQNCPCCY